MLAIPKPRNIPFGELVSLDIHRLNQTLASDLSRFTSGTISSTSPSMRTRRTHQAKPLSMLIKFPSCRDKNRIRAIARARETKNLQGFAE